METEFTEALGTDVQPQIDEETTATDIPIADHCTYQITDDDMHIAGIPRALNLLKLCETPEYLGADIGLRIRRCICLCPGMTPAEVDRLALLGEQSAGSADDDGGTGEAVTEGQD